MDETKIIYHMDDEDTPYLVKLPKSPTTVTLADFKNMLNRPNTKFFFKSMDDDFGVVKEELTDDEANLPCFNGRVVAWLVTSDGSVSGDSHGRAGSDAGSTTSDFHVPVARTGGIGDSRPPSFHPGGGNSTAGELDSEVDSVASSRRSSSRRPRERPPRVDSGRHRMQGQKQTDESYESSSFMSSDLESTSYMDSTDEDAQSRISSTTEGSRIVRNSSRHRRRRRRPRMPRVERCSSFSTITESTMSLNIITVTLDMQKSNFLGISIVGQSNKRGDGGIYVGSIMKGGAVALDGRIEPGDMLLQVNDVNFENMTNDDAVRCLREMVHKPGPITLTVAKCWDHTPKGYFTLPHTSTTLSFLGEPVRPIDTSAWVQHTTAARAGEFIKNSSSQLSSMTSTSSSITSSLPESDRFDLPDGEGLLTVNTDYITIVKAMSAPESGLDIRDRMWLKITIPNAFIGSDLVDWLYSHVEGFTDRREARKYACSLLKMGFIRHTVNKITFSEQCYYVFGDLCGNMAAITLHDHDGSDDQDTLAPLPQTTAPWIGGPPVYPHYQPVPYVPPPPAGPGDPLPFAYPYHSSGSGGGSPHGSQSSGSHRSVSEKEREARSSGGSSSEKSGSSKGKSRKESKEHLTPQTMIPPPQTVVQPPPPPMMQAPPSPQQVPQQQHTLQPTPQQQQREFGRLDTMPQDMSASRNSFKCAMNNPCEYFVDVM